MSALTDELIRQGRLLHRMSRTGPASAPVRQRLLWLWLLTRSEPHYAEGEVEAILERGGIPAGEVWADALPASYELLPPVVRPERLPTFIPIINGEWTAAVDTVLVPNTLTEAIDAEWAAEDDTELTPNALTDAVDDEYGA